MQKLTVDFYQVEVSGDDSFEQAMTTLQQLPNNAARNMTFQDAPVRLRELVTRNNDWQGDLMKIRLNEAAIIANLNGRIEPVGIDGETGLGENTAFYYDHALKVIAVQRNRTAVSASKLAFYFGTMGRLQNAVIFKPILRLEALQQLRNMRSVKKFHIKISPPANLRTVGEAPTLLSAAQMAADFQSPSVEVVFSTGRHKGSLRKNPVVELAQRLLRLHNDDHCAVQKIEVSGKDEEDTATGMLDLIEERLHVAMPIEVSPLHNEFYNRRQTAIQAAFDAKRAEIRAMVLPE